MNACRLRSIKQERQAFLAYETNWTRNSNVEIIDNLESEIWEYLKCAYTSVMINKLYNLTWENARFYDTLLKENLGGFKFLTFYPL